MTNKLAPCAAFTAFALATAGCQSMVDNQVKPINAGHTGCTPEEITIDKRIAVGIVALRSAT
jgi:hypothetical protein